MRAFRFILVLILLYSSISYATTSSFTIAKGFGLKNRSDNTNDTSDINHYTKLALSNNAPKSMKIQYMKAYIDTAELICKEKNIEIPPLLHLARAEYFFITSDFNNASQEATIALKLAVNEGDNIVIAKANYFLGKYSHRTGSFKESIDYYAQSIEVARKNRLKGFLP